MNTPITDGLFKNVLTSFSMFFFFVASAIAVECESRNNCVSFTCGTRHFLFMIKNLQKQQIYMVYCDKRIYLVCLNICYAFAP